MERLLKKPGDCDPLISDFLSYLASEKAAPENTYSAYGRDCLAFSRFLSVRQSSLQEVKPELIIAFLSERQSQGYASASLYRQLVSLKMLFRFLKREQFIEVDPTRLLTLPKLWQRLPVVLTIDEVERLLAQPNPQTHKGCRDRAILELLYSTGLRVSELCRLTLYDVEDHFVKTMGKGSVERLVPVGAAAIAAVDDYLHRFRSLFDSEHNLFLFVTLRGTPLRRLDVWKYVKQYAAKAGIEKDISPHTLRHSYATHLLNQGADVRVIQELLGHASIASTDRYTQVSKAHLVQAFNNCHPRP